jgi:hypothetical protein
LVTLFPALAAPEERIPAPVAAWVTLASPVLTDDVSPGENLVLVYLFGKPFASTNPFFENDPIVIFGIPQRLDPTVATVIGDDVAVMGEPDRGICAKPHTLPAEITVVLF